MKINCLSCGHNLDLDDTYDDYEGCVKCWCGTMLDIKIQDGLLQLCKVTETPSSEPPKHRRMASTATP